MDRKEEKRGERDVFKTVCAAMAVIFVVICVVWSFIGY